METARQLALRYQVDPIKAEVAAKLHDVYRELSEVELRRLAKEIDWPLPDEDPATWHGPLVAARLALDFGIVDTGIEEAIAWHTLGHPLMGELAKIIYVADAIEPGRHFPGVADLRLAATISLSLATAVVADASLRYLLDLQLQIPDSTLALRNKMWRQVDEPTRKEYNQSRGNG